MRDTMNQTRRTLPGAMDDRDRWRERVREIRATDTGCSLENPPVVMDDRDGWRERVLEICAGGATG